MKSNAWITRMQGLDGGNLARHTRMPGFKNRLRNLIINECTADCGENVGASSNPAPAQADSDDGDGDGDPDPERRRIGRPRNTRNSLPSTVENFDQLPDSALVGIVTIRGVTGKSRATVYRWIDKGILPKPRKLGLTHNVWAAGDIRRALQA